MWNDLRTAVRGLVRSPGFAIVAVLTLALGIAFNTVVYSVVRSVVCAPLPYPDADRLVAIWSTRPAENEFTSRSALANVEDWLADSGHLVDAAVHDPVGATLSGGDGAAERVAGVAASPSFFGLLGGVTTVGRTYTAAEAERRDRVVVLSHALWQRRYGGDREAVGRDMIINGSSSRIIGVMSPDFGYLDRDVAFWEPHTLSGDWPDTGRGTGGWQVIGRLAPGIGLHEAQTELSGVAARLEASYPDANRGLGVRLVGLRDQWTGGTVRSALWALWGAVGFVMLIVCANVANLLLARGAARRKEMATRAALGAGTARLSGLVLTESLALSLAGGALGAAAAVWALDLLPLLGAGDLPRLDRVSADVPMLAFSLVLSVAVGLIFGILPAFIGARTDLMQTLRSGGRLTKDDARPRVRRALVVAELALAVVTLTGAGLLGRSLVRVLDQDMGFDPQDLAYARISLPPDRSAIERIGFFDGLFDRLERLEGVEAVGAVDDLFVTNNPNGRLTLEGGAERPGQERSFTVDEVTPGFFSAMRIPLLTGRIFDERDRSGSVPVALVNESMARNLWPDQDPVGRRVQIGAYEPAGEWLTVVGVVGDFRRSGPEGVTHGQVFRPYAQTASRSMTIVVRATDGDLGAVLSALRGFAAEAEPGAPVFAASTMTDQLAGFFATRRFQTRLLSAFSLAALLLAAIGVFALISQSVQRRSGEIGARMAVGATRGDILRLVLREGAVLISIGLGTGLVGAVVVARLLRSQLFDVAPTDPLTLIGACGALAVAALLSCLAPALRATRLDPASVLRSD